MTEIILKIATELGVFTIAAFFIKKIIENSAYKRLEEYKSTLSIIQSKQTSLHTERLKIVEELYEKLVDLNSSMFVLTNPVKQSEKNFKEYEAELTENASKSYNALNTFFQKKRIYFNEKTCAIMDEMLNAFHQAYWDYHEHKFYEGTGVTDRETIVEARKKMMDSYKSVKDEIPKIRKNLEEDFRRLLDVE